MEKIKVLKKCLKRKIKVTEALLIAFLITGSVSVSETIQDAQNQIDSDNKVVAGVYEGDSGANFINSKAGTIFEGDVTFNVKETGNEAYLSLVGEGVMGDKLTVNITPNTNVKHSRPKGLIIRGNSNAEIKELISNVTLASDTENGPANGPDSNASYGVAVGYNHNGGASSDLSKLNVGKMSINVTNTPDTIKSKRVVTKRVVVFNVKATVDFDHQLSGLKIYRKDGAKAEFVANDKVDITVTDSSTSKSGQYLAGIYISGDETKAEFNGETNITIVGNGRNSAGIKIGKPLDSTITNAGPKVIFNGKLNLNTTENTESGAIRLFGDKATLEITGKNTDEVSLINSGNSAIVYDTQDYVTDFKAESFITVNGKASRNSNANDQIVKLHNTELKTTSNDASLIKVKAERVIDETLGQAKNFTNQLNSGEFANKNATFELSGEKSSAVAGTNGWLIEVMDIQRNDKVAASLTTNIKDNATIIGLVHKGTNATLNMNIENGVVWTLAKKGEAEDENRTSSLSTLTMSNSKLDASVKNLDDAKADYIINADRITNNESIINLANDSYEDKLVINGNYTANQGRLLVNTQWDTPGDAMGANSKTDILEINGEASGTTVIETIDANGNKNVIDGSVDAIIDELSRTKAVVKVKNDLAPGRTFTGKVSSTSASEIWLGHKNVNGVTEYFWQIKKIIDKVPNYIAIPSLVYEQGYATLDTLNERKGNFVKADDTKQVWTRLYGRYTGQEGKERLKIDTSLIGFQNGIEKIKDNKHTGLYLSYTASLSDIKAKTDIQVSDNSNFEYVGRINTHGLSLGLTHTRYSEKGAYVDLVGQLSYYISNIYDNELTYITRANSLGLVLSAEAGKPYYIKDNKYIIEPQTQIIYQVSKTLATNDGVRDLSFGIKHGLKARAGLRFMGAESNFYGLANLWVDITNASKVYVGQDKLADKLSNLWLELGVGGQKEVRKNLYLYGDARVEIGLNKKIGVKANIGLKKEW